MRRRLDASALREKSLKLERRGDSLLVPLVPEANSTYVRKELKGIGLRFSEAEFEPYPKGKEIEASDFLSKMPSAKLALLPRSYDIIGDIIILELDPLLVEDSAAIGMAMLKLHQHTHSVYAKAGPIAGEYRLRPLTLIAGERKTETLHKENGCQFKLNVETTFYNPRLASERRRVVGRVAGAETVLDMFAGVGPFSIQIAKHAGVRVLAIDSNPEAVRYLQENLRLNKVQDRVKVFGGDAKALAPRFKGSVDRVIMNLPESSAEYIGMACLTLKPKGGMIHFYSFQEGLDPIAQAREMFTSRVEAAATKVEEIQAERIVHEIGPRMYMTVIDAKLS